MLDTPARPHALNMREVYLTAMDELLTPFPAALLPDWRSFNQMTGGFRAREFTIFCGPTGTGKTTFLANLSTQLLKQQIKHFVMSVETGHTDFMKRVMSVLEGWDLNTGDPLTREQLAQIHTRNAKYLESDTIEFSLYENRVSVEQVMSDLKYMVEVEKCKIAMIDNLNFLLEVTRSADQLVEMDRVIHELIIFCKSHDIHIIMVMHPRKTEHGRVVSEFDIKGSSTAVQEAHNVFLFNRPDKERIDKYGASPFERELTIQKMRRRGTNVGKTLVFDSAGTRYTEKGYL